MGRFCYPIPLTHSYCYFLGTMAGKAFKRSIGKRKPLSEKDPKNALDQNSTDNPLWIAVTLHDDLKDAERAGFEPAIGFHLYTLSRRASSTTRAPLRKGSKNTIIPCLVTENLQSIG